MRRILLALTLAAAAVAVAVPVQAASPALERVTTAHGNVVEFDNAAEIAHVRLVSNWVTVQPCRADGLYGFSADQATNAAGQTLRWEFAVDINYAPECGGSDYVRYYQKLICSGNVSSPWCNFSSDGGFMYKPCLPDQSCTISNYGFGHLTSCPANCNKTSTIIYGNWHLALIRSYKTCSTDFYVHFLNPDNNSQHRQRSSKWVYPWGSEYAGSSCQA